MKRLRLLFYFTTIEYSSWIFLCCSSMFFVQYAMLAKSSLVVFVWTVYGIMTGLYLKKSTKQTGFFIIEG